MPQWVLLLLMTVAAWMVVAVVGGLLVGRVLSVLDRSRREAGKPPSEELERPQRAASR